METTTIHHEVALTGVNNIRTELARLHDNRHASFVSIESYLAWIPDDQLIEIFQQIGLTLRRNLKTFRISFSFQRFRQLPVLPIPALALIRLIDSSPLLETLTLDECRFVFQNNDNIDDVERLSLALQQAPNLKHVTLFNCFPHHHHHRLVENHNNDDNIHDAHDHHHHHQQAMEDDGIHDINIRHHRQRSPSSSSSLLSPDPLAHGLSQIPSLEELNLIFTMEGDDEGTGVTGNWIQSLLRKSCSSQTTKTLRINVPDRSCLGDPFKCMCQNLETTNSTLKELSIRCPLDDVGGIALANALSSQYNTLEEIYIQMKSYVYAVPIALALRDNQHLRSLELRVWTGGDRSPLLQAYEQIIPHNLTLQQLIIDNGRHGLTPVCDFYLSLNRNGRKQLLISGGENIKIQTLIDFWFHQRRRSVDDDNDYDDYPSDVSVLFYTLSLNPGLITTTTTTATTGSKTTTTKSTATSAGKSCAGVVGVGVGVGVVGVGRRRTDNNNKVTAVVAAVEVEEGNNSINMMNIDEDENDVGGGGGGGGGDDEEPRHKKQKLEVFLMNK